MAEDITENSEITRYQNSSKPLCIKVNDKVPTNRRSLLEQNKEDLLRKYSQFGMTSCSGRLF